jgi:hypothetical protein
MSLSAKLKKNSTIKLTATLSESKVYGKKEMVQTSVPMMNVALSGSVDGGLTPGLTVIAGPSKHFKTLFTILLAAAYLKKYPDAVILFYDNEFGSPSSYFESFGIDPSRIIHTPFTDIEELKFDIMNQLKSIERGDRVFIMIDSVGNAASKKEVEDAEAQKSVGDMSRAKQLKSVFRMITPHLTIKDIPMVAVNHTYQTQEMYSKAVVSGGTGIYYSADTIWIVGRQQETEGTGAAKEVTGYNFIINIEKSRYVKEKSKIPISVSWETGVAKWSGLFDVAMDGGYIVAPKQGWYALVDRDTGEVSDKSFRRGDVEDDGTFWKKMFTTTDFKDFITKTFKVSQVEMLSKDEADEFVTMSESE